MTSALWLIYLHSLFLLLNAGIDILTAHELMAKQQRFQRAQHRLWQLCQSIAEGHSYYHALKSCAPPPIIHLYLHMGEQSGQLDSLLYKLYLWLKRQLFFKQQCIQALIYPAFILMISISFLLLMIFWVLPQFISLYSQMNADIPGYVTAIVHYVTPNACIISVASMIILIVLLNLAWIKQGSARLKLEQTLYRIPILGSIFYHSDVSQHCELLALSCRSGIPLIEGLALLSQHGAQASGRRAWGQVHTALLQGSSLSEAMKQVPYFDHTITELIDIGERTGKLDEVFEQCAVYYTEMLSASMGQLKEAIQPTIMLVLGLMLGGWVIMLYYPIIQLGYHLG